MNHVRSSVPSGIGAKDTKEERRKKKEEGRKKKEEGKKISIPCSGVPCSLFRCSLFPVPVFLQQSYLL